MVETQLISRLKGVNNTLWQIEDQIREQESLKNFGEAFVQLARSIYHNNDLRAAIKKEINTTYDSTVTEQNHTKILRPSALA